MADLNINRRQNSSDKIYNFSHSCWSLCLILFVFFFSIPLLFCRLYAIFFIDSKIYETGPLQFPRWFSLFYGKKTLREKNFLLNVCEQVAKQGRRRQQAPIKSGNLGATHTPLWILIGRIIFHTREKTSFAILIASIIFHGWKTSFVPMIG